MLKIQLVAGHTYLVSPLLKMSKPHANNFNSTGKLRHQIESDYNVKLGGYVRTIHKDVFLFFPSKIGLTGNGWAATVFAAEMAGTSDTPFLARILLDVDSELYHPACRRFYKSLGLKEVTEELFESQPSNCLYAWYNNHLYRVGVAHIDGTMYMEEVPN